MKCIQSDNTNPYFNLAAEEYLLKNFTEDFFFIYRNEPSVVIGKHQNAMAEVDHDFLEQNNIILARRISGGGAVYHDLGNINYSFITTESPGNYIRFKTYTAPIIEAMAGLGLMVELGSRNELLLGEKKISGTASHVFKSRVLHHGTLLFDTDLTVLSKSLYVDSTQYKDKAVKSVRSEVVNLRESLPDLDSDSFFNFLSGAVADHSSGKRIILSDDDKARVRALSESKFTSWEWNYGYSPKYEIDKEINGVQFRVEIQKGKIILLDIQGDASLKRFADKLLGCRHDISSITDTLKNEGCKEELMNQLIEGII